MGKGGEVPYERYEFVLYDGLDVKIVQLWDQSVYDDLIIGFSIQHSINVAGGWEQVIRVDTCHGTPHVHRFGRSGKETKRDWANMDLADAFLSALELVVDGQEENVRRWRQA